MQLFLCYINVLALRNMHLDRLGSVDGHGTTNELSEAIDIHMQFWEAYGQ